MGVYVWVSKYCCNEELQFQSKSHPTKEYGEVDAACVPLDMARHIAGDTVECPHCMRTYTIKYKERDYETVPMEIVCDNEDEVGNREEEDDTEERLQRVEKQLGLRK